MTIEEALVYKLVNDTDVSALVGNRVRSNTLGQRWTLPAIVYQRISGSRVASYSGASGRARPRIQFSCYAETYSEARNLADKVRLCLDGFKGTISTEANVGGIHLENDHDDYMSEVAGGIPRVLMDFMIPHFESTT